MVAEVEATNCGIYVSTVERSPLSFLQDIADIIIVIMNNRSVFIFIKFKLNEHIIAAKLPINSMHSSLI
jgi:hypothetical protein